MSKKEIKKESRQKPTPYTIEQREENGGEKAKELVIMAIDAYANHKRISNCRSIEGDTLHSLSIESATNEKYLLIILPT